MKTNTLAATLGAIIGATVVYLALTGRDILLTEARHGTGQR